MDARNDLQIVVLLGSSTKILCQRRPWHKAVACHSRVRITDIRGLIFGGPLVTVVVQMLAHALKHLGPDDVTQRLNATDHILEKADLLLRNTGYHFL